MWLVVTSQDAPAAAELIRDLWAEGLDPETLAAAECAIDLDAEEATCPACGEPFQPSDLRCPTCGLRIG